MNDKIFFVIPAALVFLIGFTLGTCIMHDKLCEDRCVRAGFEDGAQVRAFAEECSCVDYGKIKP